MSTLCGKCRHPVWSISHYWQCGWRDQSYRHDGTKKIAAADRGERSEMNALDEYDQLMQDEHNYAEYVEECGVAEIVPASFETWKKGDWWAIKAEERS